MNGLASALHATNLAVHIAAGAVAMAIGVALVARAKGTRWHLRAGAWYARFAIVVSASAAVGTLAFRYIPLFATLTVLTMYQLFSGWRDARRKAAPPAGIDLVAALVAIGFAAAIVPTLLGGPHIGSSTPVVVFSTLGALGMLVIYDLARFAFPSGWHARLWRYSHTYKLISSLAAMMSALAGNVVRAGQPWSQIAPSAIGMIAILWMFVVIARKRATPPPGLRR